MRKYASEALMDSFPLNLSTSRKGMSLFMSLASTLGEA